MEFQKVTVAFPKEECSVATNYNSKSHEHLVIKGGFNTLVEIFDNATNWASTETFLVFENERLSYKDVHERVMALRAKLESICVPGDRVAISSKNTCEWIIALVAAMWSGFIAVPMNSWWTSKEMEYGLNDCGAKVLFLDEERFERFSKIPGTLSSLKYVCNTSRDKSFTITSFTNGSAVSFKPNVKAKASIKVNPDAAVMIMYTSGTTGHPKGVVLTHRGVCHTMNVYRVINTLETGLQKKAQPRTPQKTILLTVPLFHATGMHGILLPSFYLQRKIVMLSKWNAEKALDLIEREKVTAFTGVPTMILELLASPSLSRRDISSLKNLGGGGAPMPKDLAKNVTEKFKGASPGQGYGLTEVNAVATLISSADYLKRPTSCGRAVPGVSIQIWDENERKVLPPKTIGRIMIKGVTVMREYWNQKEASNEAITSDGWFDSGDLGIMDEEGFVYIQDRAKDMIIRGGENISCRTIEENVYSLFPEMVMECAAVGIPHPTLGEEVALAVFLKDEKFFKEFSSKLRDSLAKQLAGFQLPVGLLHFHTELPRGATGKTLKKEIRNIYNKKLFKESNVDWVSLVNAKL